MDRLTFMVFSDRLTFMVFSDRLTFMVFSDLEGFKRNQTFKVSEDHEGRNPNLHGLLRPVNLQGLLRP
jgi:hypothetical protein